MPSSGSIFPRGGRVLLRRHCRQMFRSIPTAAAFIAPLLVDRPQKLRAEGYVNKLKEVDLSQLGGVTGQVYYEGVYELKDDEALIVETKLPARCTNGSLVLTDEIYETIDWYNNPSRLNAAQAPSTKTALCASSYPRAIPVCATGSIRRALPRASSRGAGWSAAVSPFPPSSRLHSRM